MVLRQLLNNITSKGRNMKILGISGLKQSGKNSSANYLSGYVLKKHSQVENYGITSMGELNVYTSYQDGSKDWGILDLNRKDSEFIESAEQTIWPFVKCYSFADSLKRTAVDLFELKPEQVWGTDEQKSSLTHLRWENMPGVISSDDEQAWCEYDPSNYGLIVHDDGLMSGREFLQFFGTEIGRKIHGPIWINATIRQIISEQSELAIITDVRFPDEVEIIQEAGGMVYRLDRQAFEDSHPSETALSKENFDWDKFDRVVSNKELNILQSCEAVRQRAIRDGIVQ